MADSVHLTLTVNGALVPGESTQTSVGRANTIECVAFDHAATVTTLAAPLQALSGATRRYAPITLRKRVDRSSPLLAKAFVEQGAVEGTFRFYRPSPTGDGTTEMFYAIAVKQARITTFRQFVDDTLAPATAGRPVLEEVSITFHHVEWTYTQGGVTHQDTV